MACGIPMISYNVGGVSELVRHGITGYLAKYNDMNDFCNGIISLLNNKNRRELMSKNCRSIAQKEYSIKYQIERYLNLYRSVLEK